MRLRNLLLLVTAFTGLLVAGAAATMLAVAQAGREGTSYIVISGRSVEAAEHVRLIIAQLESGKVEMSAVRPELDASLRTASDLVQSPAEQAIVERLTAAIDTLGHPVDVGDPVRRAQTFASASSAAEALVDINMEQAREAEAEVAARASQAERRSLLAAALLVGGMVAIALWARRRLLKPLSALEARIRGFASGTASQADLRRVPQAPPELEAVMQTFEALREAAGRQRRERLELLSRVAQGVAPMLARAEQALEVIAHSPAMEPAQQAAVERAARDLVRVGKLTDEYVEAARIEAGVLELERAPVELDALVGEAVELFRSLAPEHTFSFSHPAQAVVADGDGRLLAHVLNHLLSVAVRSAAQARVELTLTDVAGQGVLVLESSSSKPASVAAIFNALHGHDQAMQGVPGAGFTLETSRRIIEAHGGRLDSSPRGPGVKFRLELAVQASQRAARSA
ncbi:MAG: HAMP domain-containing histidine kinase [Deltaproteobacteria bacterium]|nr:HAMP domain-containing histidine kinase [Deltaproteobacteria bacterium]